MRILYSALLLLLVSPIFAAAQVTLTGVERSVQAGTESRASSAPGAFDETAFVTEFVGVCTPFGCPGTTVTFLGNQRSMVTAAPNGALEVRAIANAHSGLRAASSRLVATFSVGSAAPFFLRASSVDGTMTLAGPAGVVVERSSATADVAEAGSLVPGTYTLTLEVSRPSSHLDVQFTAGPALDPLRPRCFLGLTRLQYTPGQAVAAHTFQIVNPASSPRGVEAKLWLRTPDGASASLASWGADGSMVLPSGFRGDYPGLTFMTVDGSHALGGYEIGCRLLDFATGQQIDEDRELFEVVAPQ